MDHSNSPDRRLPAIPPRYINDAEALGRMVVERPLDASPPVQPPIPRATESDVRRPDSPAPKPPERRPAIPVGGHEVRRPLDGPHERTQYLPAAVAPGNSKGSSATPTPPVPPKASAVPQSPAPTGAHDPFSPRSSAWALPYVAPTDTPKPSSGQSERPARHTSHSDATSSAQQVDSSGTKDGSTLPTPVDPSDIHVIPDPTPPKPKVGDEGSDTLQDIELPTRRQTHALDTPPPPPHDHLTTEIRLSENDYTELGRRLLHEFSQGHEVPGEAQVDDFFAQQGLGTQPALLVRSETVGSMVSFLEKNGNQGVALDTLRDWPEGMFAFFDRHLNLVFIRQTLETSFQSQLRMQAILAHEKAHSNQEHRIREITTPDGLEVFRYASYPSQIGSFSREGYAEWQAGRFLASKDLPNGMWPDSSLITVQPGVSLPPRYVWTDPEGGLATSYSAYAAYTLDLLSTEYPWVPRVLVNMQRDPTAMRVFSATLKMLKPGLYASISFDTASMHPSEGFVRGLRRVQTALEEKKRWS